MAISPRSKGLGNIGNIVNRQRLAAPTRPQPQVVQRPKVAAPVVKRPMPVSSPRPQTAKLNPMTEWARNHPTNPSAPGLPDGQTTPPTGMMPQPFNPVPINSLQSSGQFYPTDDQQNLGLPFTNTLSMSPLNQTYMPGVVDPYSGIPEFNQFNSGQQALQTGQQGLGQMFNPGPYGGSDIDWANMLKPSSPGQFNPGGMFSSIGGNIDTSGMTPNMTGQISPIGFFGGNPQVDYSQYDENGNPIQQNPLQSAFSPQSTKNNSSGSLFGAGGFADNG